MSAVNYGLSMEWNELIKKYREKSPRAYTGELGDDGESEGQRWRRKNREKAQAEE